jgi:hypothetical protein
MWKTPLVWKAEPGSAPDSAFTAQLGNLITYYAKPEPTITRPTLSCAVRVVV